MAADKEQSFVADECPQGRGGADGFTPAAGIGVDAVCAVAARRLGADRPSAESAHRAVRSAPSAAPSGDQMLKPEELDALVAPIALYPDSLLSLMLMASTYPLEVVRPIVG